MQIERDSQSRFIESEAPKHECGVFGVYAPGQEVARLSFWGLTNLQHRGQESAGIATLSEGGIDVEKRMGLLREGFREEDIKSLLGYAAIGQTRYSNTGGSNIANAQPMAYKDIAIAQNGNLINSLELRSALIKKGIYPSVTDGISCSSDGEIIAQVIATSEGKNIIGKIQTASREMLGAYSLTILAEESLIAVKDPHGFWPLCIGKLNGIGYVIASESAALDIIKAQYVREIEPGEIVQINQDGIKSFKLAIEARRTECAFDITYFRAPDSLITPDIYVYQFRKELGRQLARDFPVEADMVIGEKDSGTFSAHGFAEESGIPFNEGSIKNPYSKRVFINPDERIRDMEVLLKHRILKPEIEGKRIILTTDSIVRSHTSKGVIATLRGAGAKEIHMRVTFPPVTDPCFVGIDMESRGHLIAADKTVEQIRIHIGADSLAYLSPESFEKAMQRALQTKRTLDTFCTACFTGDYPIPVPEKRDKFELEQDLIKVV